MNYFNDDLAQDVWASKYQFEGETIDQFFDRITDSFYSKVKTNYPEDKIKLLSRYGQERFKKSIRDRFKDLFSTFTIVPGGSILSGVGTGKPVSLSNCYVIDTDDSIEDIFNTSKTMAQIYKRRGGVGVDVSKLRPAGAPVKNAAQTTSGVVPFMELFSQTTNTIGQEGRRGALMISIDLKHPDSPQFVVSKQDLTKITGANISVKISDDFMRAVENDEDYILRWPCDIPDWEESEMIEYNKLYEQELANAGGLGIQKIYLKKIKAKELWDSIIQCAWSSAEPGILFWDNILDNDPASVYEKYRAVSTNPCGEIPLSPYDSCRLIAVNMYNIVDNPFTDNSYIDENKAYEIFYEAQIIGDILVDLELDHIDYIISITEGDEQKLWKKVREIGASGRRTGVGLLGLGDMYAALGLPYGEEETTERVMQMKQHAELAASIDLAILEGPFSDYNRDLEYTFFGVDEKIVLENMNDYDILPKNQFFENILSIFPDQVYKMLKFGRRNISFSTIAPTGSISILAGTSSGCEPVYSLYYTRRKKCNSGETPDFIDQNGVGFKNFNVIHPKLNVWWNEYKKSIPEPRKEPLSDWTKEDLDFIIKFSPWYNNEAENIIPEVRIRTQSILQKYVTHSISSTINLANDVDKEIVDKLYKLAHKEDLKGVTVYRDGSRSGILVKETNEQNTTLERPSELNCQVVHFKNERKEWVAFIGIIDGMPYEIFTGPKDLDVFPIPSSVTEGIIIKVRQENEHSRYDFRYVDSYGYTNTLGGLSRIFDKEYWNYGRLVSGLLRSKIPVEQVVKIVDGLNFTKAGLNNWKSGVIRSLKSFIKDGTKADGVKCENCGSSHIVYQEGCLICRDCGSSKCG